MEGGSCHGTVGQNNEKYRLEYWATRSSVRSFARTAHSRESEFLMSQNDLVLSHSGLVGGWCKGGKVGEWWMGRELGD